MALNNVRRQTPQPGKLLKVTLTQLVGNPSIWCEFLGDTNVGFRNDRIKGTGGVKVGSAKSTPEERDRVRDANRTTVAKHSARRVEDFYHDGGDGEPDLENPVKSDENGIAEVIFSLPDDVFDSLLMIVIDPDNYRDGRVATPPAELAKK